jgi:hypothetical protein
MFGGVTPRILNLDNKLRRVVRSMSRPRYSGANNRFAHCTGDWVGPRAVLQGLEEGKIVVPT